MGADWQETEIHCTDLTKGFSDLVESAAYDYGHAGYTGSFAEKSSVQCVPVPPDIDADRFVEHVRDLAAQNHQPDTVDSRTLRHAIIAAAAIADDKWGPALAIPLGDDRYAIMGWCSS